MFVPSAKLHLGKQSVIFPIEPRVLSFASIVGDVEGKGFLADHFDLILQDDLWGQDSWEKAESKMLEQAVRMALEKGNITENQIDCFLAGDLLNQIISCNFAARQLGVPFLGLYGACSSMAESLLIGAMLISGQFISATVCGSCSHFSAAERQYRYPLEYGNQRPPSAQRTVTGAGVSIIVPPSCKSASCISLTHGTIGKVVDLGIKDANNMGAAMAPAASDTIVTHLNDLKRTVDDYDLIVTGDLGIYGSILAKQLCSEQGVELGEKHFDCGASIFNKEQDAHGGGSGCGCCASVLNGFLYGKLLNKSIKRMLFVATGALMNPDIALQGESIPCIAHAIVFERK